MLAVFCFLLGLKASIVPMRNCIHSSNKTIFSKRLKREILKGGVRRSNHKVSNERSILYGDNLSDSLSDDIKLSKTKNESEKLINTNEKNVYMYENSDKNEGRDRASDDNWSDYDRPQMTSDEALIELQGKIKVKHDKANAHQIKDKEIHEEDLKEISQSAEDIIHMNSGDSVDYNDAMHVPEHTEETNADIQGNIYCPSTCAAVDTMVCARCHHGVYRTFMSVCHLRAFTCAHKDEKLSLVSRRPCMQSAPFLSNLPKYKGRLRDSTDRDRVLRFIRCRAEGRLGKDSKCTFDL